MIKRARRPIPALVAAAAAMLTVAAGCGSSSTADDGADVAIVGYSVPKPAYDDLQQAFNETEKGSGVTFSSSYGASGSQSKSVANGQPADLVAFSLEPDMTRLVPDHVEGNWSSGPTKGMISDSVVVLVVREGNPKNITGWEDLVEPGIQIVTPDPASSGSAKWNILAAYAQEITAGGDEASAAKYVTALLKNVVSKPASGAQATTTFDAGTGDVLISYENEAIAARSKGAEVDYIVPDRTFLIENPVAVTTGASQQAKDFLDFAMTPTGQKIFAGHGFRPVLDDLEVGRVDGANDPDNPFPAVDTLSTIADLGGWKAVDEKFFGDKGIITTIQNAAG